MQITIYSTTTCPYCRDLKKYLSSKGVAFTEKLIDMDENSQKEMSEVSNGFLGVPFSVFISDNGQTETVLGFDRGKIDSILNKSSV